MHVRARVRVAIAFSGTVLTLVACGGAARRQPAAAAGPPPEVVRQLQVPETPDRIIYTPPVSLAKRPDTTAHAPKARR